MGWMDWFSGKPGRFVNEAQLAENLSTQLQLSPVTLKQLRKFGVTAESRIKLQYFFATNTPEKAEALSVVLKRLGYEVEYGPSTVKKQQMVQGWTAPMLMTENVILAWTRKMCESGYVHDCAFDGWGTDGRS